MNFLDQFVLPQNLEHLSLLQYLTIIALWISLTYLGMLVGGTGLSLYYKRKGVKESNPHYLKFAKDIIEQITISKTAGITLGIVPILSLMMMFAQLMTQIQVGAVTYLIFSFFIVTVAVVLVFTYRYSYSLKERFLSLKSAVDEKTGEEVNAYAGSLSNLSNTSGSWAFTFLMFGTYFFVAGVSIGMFPGEWAQSSSIFYALLSGTIFVKWLVFLAFALAVTGAYLLFVTFAWNTKSVVGEGEYIEVVKAGATKTVLLGSFLLPLLIAMATIITPNTAVTPTVYIAAFAAVLLVFFVYNLVYQMIKSGNTKFAVWIFFFVLMAIGSLAISDTSATKATTKAQHYALDSVYKVQLLAELGDAAAPVVSGEDIYNGRCSACHKFDQKLVGPPYQETLPKYEGNVDKLAAFVLNPVKINPDYPAMPNQGLKPNEAKAIAEYILSKYKK